MSPRICLYAGVAGLIGESIWDLVRALTSPVLGSAVWWQALIAGVLLGVAASVAWIRWARRPTPRWRPWQWVTSLALIPTAFVAHTGPPPSGGGLLTALWYECVAYLGVLVVLIIRWPELQYRVPVVGRPTPPRPRPRPPGRKGN